MKFAMGIAASAVLLMGSALRNPSSDGLTVHEWGTFTSISGEDGMPLYWNALGCTTELPKFIKDNGLRNLKANYNTTVRMETPVMYFYSLRALTANVAVQFPKGLVSEWYPQAGYRDQRENGLSSRIEWNNIRIQPGTQPALPSDGSPNPYYAARATDAAPLEVKGEHEKFLFYRGIGNFTIPIVARAVEGGKVLATSIAATPVPAVLLFDNHAGQMRYRMVGSLSDSKTLEAPDRTTSPAELRKVIEAQLIEQGLYAKEAQAMLDTWHDSWFEEGTRLIYIVPSKTVDEILPLTIEPAPQQTVRVFVGRLELISDATREAVTTAVAKDDWNAVTPYRRFLKQIVSRVPALQQQSDNVLGRFACILR